MDAEKLKRTVITPGDFSAGLGAFVDSVGPGSAVLRLTIRKELLNAMGLCHGGVLFALADTAAALAAHTRGKVSPTIEGSISFISAAHEGDTITASAAEIGLKNNLGFYSVKIQKIDGTVLAEFRTTVLRTAHEI